MLIIDGSHLLHRVRFQSPEPSWKMFSFIFTRSLLKTIKLIKDKDAIICWDHHGSRRRRCSFESYKEREPIDESTQDGQDLKKSLDAYVESRKWLHKSLPLMGFRSLMVEGIEADDIAYWIVTKKIDYSKKDNLELWYLITEDLDWMQSLAPGWVLIRPLSGDKTTFDDFVKRFYIPVTNTNSFINPRIRFVMKKSLEGKGSNGIPGCYGIGDVNSQRFSEILLKNQLLDLSKSKDKAVLEFIKSGQLSRNLELIDFEMTSRSERRKLNIAFDETQRNYKNPDLMDWIELASQIDSAQMVDFGAQYLEGW